MPKPPATPHLTLVDQSLGWSAAKVRENIAQLRQALLGEEERIESWCAYFSEFVQSGIPQLSELVEKAEAICRSIASMVTRFLEGERFTYDDRCQIRLWAESLITFGVLTEEGIVVPLTAETIALPNLEQINDDAFVKARSFFERLSTSMMCSSKHMLDALSQDSGAAEPLPIEPEPVHFQDYEQMLEVEDELEDQFFFSRLPFRWNDHCLGLHYLEQREHGKKLDEIIAVYRNEVLECIKVREKEYLKLQQIDKGSAIPQILMEDPEDIGDNNPFEELDPEFEAMMADIADKMSLALANMDSNSQFQGTRKRARRKKGRVPRT